MSAQQPRSPGAASPLAAQRVRDEVSGPLRVTAGLVVPAQELVWRFSRSSGPGGQGVNTADSRVELLFDLGATAAFPEPLKDRALSRLSDRLVDGRLSVVSSESRTQLANRRAARERLAGMLAGAVAAPPRARRATKPSRSAVARRLDDKTRRSKLKDSRRAPSD